MKKIMSILLAALLAASLAACGGTQSGEVKAPSTVAPSGVYDAVRTDTEPTEKPAVDPTPAPAPERAEAAIEETVLLDEAGVKITARSLNTDSLFGPQLKLLIENNSGKDLTVQSRDSSVNGYMVDTLMSVDVADGKKANDTMTFLSSDLELCGIETIADMEFSFHIFESDGWDTYLDTALIPLKTSAADGYHYVYDDSGDLAYEGSGVKIVVKGLSEDDSFFGPSVIVYIENSGDRAITVQTRDTSVNGFMVDSICSTDVTPGKRAIDGITFMSSDLEENGIESIEDVELSFHIFDADSWNTIADSEKITITFG